MDEVVVAQKFESSPKMAEKMMPLHSRGAGHMAGVLKGTENEIWTKYLKFVNKHKAMSHSDWMAEIERAKTVKAKAYS
jgi:hypothetical protein